MDEESYSNVTANKTEEFDPFCTQLSVGPLVLITLSVPCLCVGVPASVWLLWVLIQRQRQGLTNDVYMLNLTVMDLIQGIWRIPSLLNYFFWRDRWTNNLTVYVEGLSSTGRPLMMAFVCVDCYMAVILPIQYRRVKQVRYRHVVCAVVWVFISVYQLIFVLDTHLPREICWVIPRILTVSVIAFCDLLVLHTLRKPDPSGKTHVHPQKRRALQTLTNSFIITMVSYLPLLVMLGVASLVPLSPQEQFCQIIMPSLIFSLFGTTIQPLLCLGNLGALRDSRISECTRGV